MSNRSIIVPPSPISPTNPSEVVFTTPNNVEYTITSDGLSDIAYIGRTFASGGTYAWNSSTYMGYTEGTESTDFAQLSYGNNLTTMMSAIAATVTSKTLTAYVGPNSTKVVVVHQHNTSLVATYTYTFKDEDLTIEAKIQNNHASQVISVPTIGGLLFEFERVPDGINVTQDTSLPYKFGPYYSTVDSTDFQVGFRSNTYNKVISSCYLIDNELGVSATPWRMSPNNYQLVQFQTYRNSLQDTNRKKYLQYMRLVPIKPGCFESLKIRLRVSTDTTWQHMLEPYKEDMLATHGELKYQITDRRWVSGTFVTFGPSVRNSTNPYGMFNYRIDQSGGSNQLISDLTTYMTNGRGVIMWDAPGHVPRYGNYRSEWNIRPSEVQDNFDNIIFPGIEGLNMEHGTLANYTYMNTEFAYETGTRTTFTANGQSGVHIRSYIMRTVISSNGDETEIPRTYTSDIGGTQANGSYFLTNQLKIYITGTWTGTIELQYWDGDSWETAQYSPNGGSTTAAVFTSNITDLNSYVTTSTSTFTNRKWRFKATAWTSGDAYCRLYLPNQVQLVITGTWAGTIALQYKDDSDAWQNHATYTTNQNITVTNIPTDWRVTTTAWTSGTAYALVDDHTGWDALAECNSCYSPTFNGHLNFQQEKLQASINENSSIFYFDTVGRYLDAYFMSKKLREEFGVSYQGWIEAYTDRHVPYVGLYTETDLVRDFGGTSSSTTITGINQSTSSPEPVFNGDLITVTITGTFSGGSIFLQKYDSGWVTVETYTTTVEEDVPSQNSLLDNIQWRFLSSNDFSGSVVATMQDNIYGSNVNFINTPTDDTSFTAAGQISDSPTPRFSNPFFGIHIYGTWSGEIYLESYDKDLDTWDLEATYTSSNVTATEVANPYSPARNWRVRSGGSWSGTANVVMGQTRTRTSMWFIKLMHYIFGEIEVYGRGHFNLGQTSYANAFKPLAYSTLMSNKVSALAGNSTTDGSIVETVQDLYIDETNRFIE